jgi:hypothetical protein
MAFAAQALAQNAPIEIQASVPAPPAKVQLFHLTPVKPPTEFINEKLKVLNLPALQMEQNHMIARGRVAAEHASLVRAYVDPATGHAHLIPNLAELVTTEPSTAPKTRMLVREKLPALARTALLDERFIPRDLTELRPADTIPVMGGAMTRSGAAPGRVIEPRQVMTLAPAVRYAAGLPVYGRGSHALVTLANDGTIVGAVRRWKAATSSETLEARISAEEVRASILRQLTPMVSKGSHAVVDVIELAYYDGDGALLQPVYHFEATVTPPTGQAAPFRVRGYVPIGQAREPIPDLAVAPAGEKPAMPKMALQSNMPAAMSPDEDARLRTEIGGAGTPDDITLGEYANQNWRNDPSYVSQAYALLDGLTSDNIAPINRTQWYVAYPWQVVGPNSRYYLNAVNVAYTGQHGVNWLTNTTNSICCDIWNVQNIGAGGNPGYGAGTGGVLATWLIMACNVVPSYYDRQNEIGGSGAGGQAFDAWWPVFQGLHNVIGFRTFTGPNDDQLWTFGHDAALGGDINATWFQVLGSVQGVPATYASPQLNGHPQVHWDRGSTMIDGRDLGQSIYAVQAQTPSGQLWNFWMGN